MNMPINPMIYNGDSANAIFFNQTRETLIDSEIYLKFVYSVENRFRSSRFYKDYKSYLMNMGLYRDQRHAALTSDMTTIQLHHNFTTLKFMTIMIIEHLLNEKGFTNTFEVVKILEDEHRANHICAIMLSQTEHEVHESNPSDFISIKQCFGNPYAFLEKYIDGMTLDICFKLLLHLKQEEQYGESFDTDMVKARQEILSWQQYTNNNI